MTADSRHELQELIEEIRALVTRLQRHDQPFATQLLEMAVIELKSRIHNIADEEFEALVDTLSGGKSRDLDIEFAETGEAYELPARKLPSARVVAIGDARRNKCKRRS